MPIGPPNYYFPTVQDDQQGSWMNITGFDAGQNSINLRVSLFIPGAISGSSMVFPSVHEYAETKVTKAALEAVQSPLPVSIGFEAAQAVGQMIAGSTINPKVEVLYRDTKLRTFTFSYIMSPANSTEQENIQGIIQSLRMRAAPSLYGAAYSDPREGYIANQANYLGINSSYAFNSPSEFIIDFYFYNSQTGQLEINQYLPYIGRCVLENIEVMFNPNSEWSTFSDGSPVSTQLILVFREMRIIDAKNIADGY